MISELQIDESIKALFSEISFSQEPKQGFMTRSDT